jgi:hypothetical protein
MVHIWLLVLALIAHPSFGRKVSTTDYTEAGTAILYFAPFYSGGGYSSEALSYVKSVSHISTDDFDLRITNHGDSINHDYVDGLHMRDLEVLGAYDTRVRGQSRKVCSHLLLFLSLLWPMNLSGYMRINLSRYPCIYLYMHPTAGMPPHTTHVAGSAYSCPRPKAAMCPFSRRTVSSSIPLFLPCR